MIFLTRMPAEFIMCGPLVDEANTTQATFVSSAERASPGRVVYKVQAAEAVKLAEGLVQTIAVACKANLVHKDKVPQFFPSMAPAIFAVKVGNEAVGSEWGMFDCTRMQIVGARQVICVDTMTILTHLDTKKVGMASIKDAPPSSAMPVRTS